jgi:hypothetical protein
VLSRGFRVRSVRCLTKNGIISNRCEAKLIPASSEFCNQISCETNGEREGEEGEEGEVEEGGREAWGREERGRETREGGGGAS